MAIEQHNVSRSPCSTSGAALVQTSEVSTGGYLWKRSTAEYFSFSLVASSPESRKADGAAGGRVDGLVQEADHALASYFSTFETIEFRGFNQEWAPGRTMACPPHVRHHLSRQPSAISTNPASWGCLWDLVFFFIFGFAAGPVRGVCSFTRVPREEKCTLGC